MQGLAVEGDDLAILAGKADLANTPFFGIASTVIGAGLLLSRALLLLRTAVIAQEAGVAAAACMRVTEPVTGAGQALQVAAVHAFQAILPGKGVLTNAAHIFVALAQEVARVVGKIASGVAVFTLGAVEPLFAHTAQGIIAHAIFPAEGGLIGAGVQLRVLTELPVEALVATAPVVGVALATVIAGAVLLKTEGEGIFAFFAIVGFKAHAALEGVALPAVLAVIGVQHTGVLLLLLAVVAHEPFVANAAVKDVTFPVA